ncbi:hypothetical protein E2562_010145 [Oryza meyeriana var. granulata]|uniref:DUF6598 domain-containing protein n=1 Tax=Oryza meyeriana var. granulata TaxID=110450 RepID=A0A6G1EI76_9ORYZ|nr:hypothetical protein E2562_010145 [Oryza meyeriana var. granulata]
MAATGKGSSSSGAMARRRSRRKGGRVLGKRRETDKPQDEEDEADLEKKKKKKSSSLPSVEKVWRLSDMEKVEGFPESIGMSAEEYAASKAKAAAKSKLRREEMPEDWEARFRKRLEDEGKAYREMMGSEDDESWSAIQYRKFWNDVYSRHHGSYEDTIIVTIVVIAITSAAAAIGFDLQLISILLRLGAARIPPMRFTHKSSLDWRARTLDTLQVFSVKVAATSGGLQWPLDVFGMVSMRDSVDRNRNVVFHRTRDNCQTLTEQMQDISWAREDNIASIEHEKIVLLDSRGEKVVVSGDGKIELSRRVVSVEKIGELKVSVKAWEVDCNVVEKVKVFTPLEAGLSNGELDIGFCIGWQRVTDELVLLYDHISQEDETEKQIAEMFRKCR